MKRTEAPAFFGRRHFYCTLMEKSFVNSVIGLIPLYDDEKESYWMLPGHMKVLEQCGGIPIMLPLTENRVVLEQNCSEMIVAASAVDK